MPLNKLPVVSKCCICVTDLKTAVAIIAVLGIVTSPAVSWAVVRHSYVIRVSCYLTTAASRADVVDINLNNVMSFGFGANAGLGPSCLGPVKKDNSTNSASLILRARADPKTSNFVNIVKYVGWVVFFADVILLMCSIHLLIKLFRGNEHAAAKRFVIAACFAILLSFIYGMMYVGACVSIGGSFPIFEFIFSICDVILWTYFLIVVNSYRRSKSPQSNTHGSSSAQHP